MVPPSRAAQAVARRRGHRAPGTGSANGVLFPENDVESLAMAIANGIQRGMRPPFAEYPLDNSGDE